MGPWFVDSLNLKFDAKAVLVAHVELTVFRLAPSKATVLLSRFFADARKHNYQISKHANMLGGVRGRDVVGQEYYLLFHC